MCFGGFSLENYCAMQLTAPSPQASQLSKPARVSRIPRTLSLEDAGDGSKEVPACRCIPRYAKLAAVVPAGSFKKNMIRQR